MALRRTLAFADAGLIATIGASVLVAELPVPRAHTAFTAHGRLRDPALATALRALVHDLLERTTRRAA